MVQSTRYEIWSECIPQLYARRSRTATSLGNKARTTRNVSKMFYLKHLKNIYLTTLTFVWKYQTNMAGLNITKLRKLGFT